MIKRIDLYLFVEVLKPLLVTLGISALLLLLERMLRLFDLVVNQGGPFLVVWEMLANLLPHYLGLAVPAGLFLGVLLAFRKLSLAGEIDALRACGLSLPRLLRPALVLSVVLTVITLILVGYVQPLGRYAYRNLVFGLSNGAFGASIKAAAFNQLGKNLTLRIEESRDKGQKLLKIFLQRRGDDGQVTTVTAREGSFLATNVGDTVLLRLIDGVLVNVDPKLTTPTVLSFGVHDWPIELPKAVAFRSRGGEQYEMTLTELWRATHGAGPKLPNREFVAALHGRLARSLAILILPFLGSALGFVSKRSGRAFGISVGTVILLTFYQVLQFGQAFVALGLASPWFSLWVPTALFAIFSGHLFRIAAYRVGLPPLAWLEEAWMRTLDALRRLMVRPKAAA